MQPTPLPTAEQIAELAPKVRRPLKLEANVVAYFGDLFLGLRSSLTAAPRKSDHKGQASIAFSQSRS
jgi:hypothetical protein